MAAIGTLSEEHRGEAERLHAWAEQLEGDGLVRLATYHGADGRMTLLCYVPGERSGLVTIWADGAVSLFRSVFQRRAPGSIPAVGSVIAPAEIRQGNQVRPATDSFLAAIRSAYEEAARTR